MALGYRLPGTVIEEIEIPGAPNPTSTQRKPCFIGKASPYKKILFESVTRVAGTVDKLEQYSTGIYRILQCGTQRGLNDIIEGVDISVNLTTGDITWLVNSESNTITGGVVGTGLLGALSTTPDPSVPGSNATSGYQEFGLTGIVGTAGCGLSVGAYEIKIGTTSGSQVNYSVVVTSGMTYQGLVNAINTQLSSTSFAVSIVGGDIRVTNTTTGSSSTVSIGAGTSNDLLAALSATPETAVAGQDATSAYQEFGLTGIVGGTSSGLIAGNVYYINVNSKQYGIMLDTGATTYSDLVSKLNAAISSDGFNVAIVGGDIRISATTPGSSSTVTITNGQTITSTSGQLELRLASPVTIARAANSSQIVANISGTDYMFVIKVQVLVGGTSITITGDPANLDLLKIGQSITIQNTPKVATGGTYYVSYEINRPSTDFMKYKEFWTFEDVLDDLGEEIPQNDLVMIAKLALKNYNVPRIAIVQVRPTATISDYINALDVIKYRDVQDVAILNSSPLCRAALQAHVVERSLPDNGRYRMAWTGAPALTPVGDSSDPNSLRGIATTLKCERVVFVNATRAKYYYTDPTTGQQATTVVDGAFIGAAVMAFRDSFPSPTTTLLGRVVPGLEPFEDDYDSYYTDYMLQQAGSDSCFLLTSSGGVFKVVDDLTTDNSTVKRNNINIITAKDYIARDVAIQMDRTFRGSLIYNRGGYAGMIKGYLSNLFISYLNNRLIESIGDINVAVSSQKPDTVVIKYSYYAVYTHKYTEGYYTILL